MLLDLFSLIQGPHPITPDPAGWTLWNQRRVLQLKGVPPPTAPVCDDNPNDCCVAGTVSNPPGLRRQRQTVNFPAGTLLGPEWCEDNPLDCCQGPGVTVDCCPGLPINQRLDVAVQVIGYTAACTCLSGTIPIAWDPAFTEWSGSATLCSQSVQARLRCAGSTWRLWLKCGAGLGTEYEFGLISRDCSLFRLSFQRSFGAGALPDFAPCCSGGGNAYGITATVTSGSGGGRNQTFLRLKKRLLLIPADKIFLHDPYCVQGQDCCPAPCSGGGQYDWSAICAAMPARWGVTWPVLPPGCPEDGISGQTIALVYDPGVSHFPPCSWFAQTWPCRPFPVPSPYVANYFMELSYGVFGNAFTFTLRRAYDPPLPGAVKIYYWTLAAASFNCLAPNSLPFDAATSFPPGLVPIVDPLVIFPA